MVMGMPRVADHDQRRALIAGAFQQLLADEGLGRASFARVAARAGVSVGLIQHYFANREALLRYAYESALRRMAQRIDDHIEAGEAAGAPIAEMMVTGLAELFPADEQRSVEYRVRQSLRTLSMTDDELAALERRAAADLHRRAATAVNNGKRCGEVGADVHAAAAATMMIAAAEGLALAVSRGEDVAAEPVLARVVAVVFTGRCAHYDRAGA